MIGQSSKTSDFEHLKMETATDRHRSKHIRIRKNKTTSRLVLLPQFTAINRDLPRFYHNLPPRISSMTCAAGTVEEVDL